MKDEYGATGKVKNFLVVDLTGWSRAASELVYKEIGKNAFPSNVLYFNGRVVNDGTPNDIRLQGPPTDSGKFYLNYVNKNVNF